MPCVPACARVARTAAVAVGGLAGLSQDTCDDLRLLVHEVFMVLYDLGANGVRMSLLPVPQELTVDIEGDTPTGPRRADPDLELARAIADVIATRVRFELDAEPPHVVARLRARPI